MIKKNRAFTLMEVIIVITIIGIMAAFALPSYTKAIAKADERTAIANLMAIRSAIEMYLTNTGTATIPADWSAPNSLTKINTNLGISIIDPKMIYECFAGGGGVCEATHPSGWVILFPFTGSKEIICDVADCPSCPIPPGNCG